MAGGGEAVLGVPAGDGRTDHAEVAVEIAHAGELRPVGHAGERRVDHHPVADRDVVDLTADLHHDARHVHARDVWQ